LPVLLAKLGLSEAQAELQEISHFILGLEDTASIAQALGALLVLPYPPGGLLVLYPSFS
jgi:hypothetical protein